MNRFAFVCLALVACHDPAPPASQPVLNAANTVDGAEVAPKWTSDAVVVDKDKGVVRAVGKAKGITNPALAMAAAENRARAMIVKAREGKTAEEGEAFAGTLEGAKVIETFVSKTEKTTYVLVEAPAK